MNEVVSTLLVTHDFQSAVGDDFVGVHIGRRPGPALDSAHNKLVMQSPSRDFFTRSVNCLRDVGVQIAQVAVRSSSSLFHPRERCNQVGVIRNSSPGNRKVLERTSSVNTPIRVVGDR